MVKVIPLYGGFFVFFLLDENYYKISFGVNVSVFYHFQKDSKGELIQPMHSCL